MPESYNTINIVLADDHELIRDGFSVLINKMKDINLMADAINGKELIDITRQHKPDVIVTDIKMPVMDGIEATKLLSKEFPEIGIIALSMFDEKSLIVEMFEAGAKGFLLKNAQKEEIVEAIKTVHKGENYYCRETNKKMAEIFAESMQGKTGKHDSKTELSEHEIEIIKLICKEMSNQEIADKLFMSKRTVEGHRAKILEKTNASNTAGIVLYAVKHEIYRG
jgi:DNA-binding NarL/FixJ family response regulator